MTINAHSHLLPYPEEIPLFMKEREIFWIDEDKKFMRQKNWRRPINGYGFFLDEKLEWMERFEIDIAVILNLSQLYCNGFDRQTARDVIRFQNDYNGRIQAEYANKFYGGFVVQPAFVEDALKEMERCVKELNLKVLCLPTHYLSLDGHWTSVADETCTPIYEMADALNLAIEIHPYDGEEIIQLKDQSWRFHLIWMCALTADTFHLFTLNDLPDRFPNIRTCFAHGNQYSLVNIGRRQQGFDGRPDLFEGKIPPNKNFIASNVYIDSIVHDPYTLQLAIQRMGIEQILFGLDDPYPLGETDIVKDCYPGKVMDEAVALSFLSSDDAEKMKNQNILRWIHGKSAP